MSGPYGPNNPDNSWGRPGGPETPGQGDDSTRVFNNPQQPGGQQQWGQQPGQQQPWGGEQQQPAWGQQPGQPQQSNDQWAQQTQVAPGAQQQWGQPQQPQQPQQQWGQQPGQQGGQQWGQPQQPHQQWGQQAPTSGQNYGQQQYGAYGSEQPKKSKLPLIIGAVIVALLVVGGVVAALLLLSKDKLDQTAAQDGVKKVLTESYGIENVSDVKCPDDQLEVKKDATFTCTLKEGSAEKSVTVKFTDDKGTYEVSRPN